MRSSVPARALSARSGRKSPGYEPRVSLGTVYAWAISRGVRSERTWGWGPGDAQRQEQGQSA